MAGRRASEFSLAGMLLPQILAWLTHFLQVWLKCHVPKGYLLRVSKNVTCSPPTPDPLYPVLLFFTFQLSPSDFLYTLFIIFIVYLPPLEINARRAKIFDTFVP